MVAIAIIVLAFLVFAGTVRAGGPVSGTASWYGPGNGVAMPFCTWTYRHSHGCGLVLITSTQTGRSTVAPVIDYCQCYVGTPSERIIDLQWGVLANLGLSTDQGLYPVTVETLIQVDMPDTAMDRPIAPHWLI